MKLLATITSRDYHSCLILGEGLKNACCFPKKGRYRFSGAEVLPDEKIVLTDHHGIWVGHVNRDMYYPARYVSWEDWDVHDIRHKDGFLYVQKTKQNCLLRFPMDKLELGNEQEFLRVHDSERDMCHFNSFIFVDDDILATRFTKHMQGERMSNERNRGDLRMHHTDGRITVLDEGLDQPHSVRFYDDQVWYCNSRSSEVVNWTTKQRWRVSNGGYTRGLVITDDSIFVGISTQKFEGNSCYRASVARIDRETGKETTYADLGQHQQVHDLIQIRDKT